MLNRRQLVVWACAVAAASILGFESDMGSRKLSLETESRIAALDERRRQSDACFQNACRQRSSYARSHSTPVDRR